jgi:hypothetical protein
MKYLKCVWRWIAKGLSGPAVALSEWADTRECAIAGAIHEGLAYCVEVWRTFLTIQHSAATARATAGA